MHRCICTPPLPFKHSVTPKVPALTLDFRVQGAGFKPMNPDRIFIKLHLPLYSLRGNLKGVLEGR